MTRRMARPVRLAVVHARCPVCHSWEWVDSWEAWRAQGGRCRACDAWMRDVEAARQVERMGEARTRYGEND